MNEISPSNARPFPANGGTRGAQPERDAPHPLLSLRSELVLWFAVVALAPILIVGAVAGRFLRRSVEASANERLATVARGRLDAVEAAVAERTRLVGALSQESSLVELCRQGAAAERDSSADPLWRSLIAAFPGGDLVVLDAGGVPIRSASGHWERGGAEMKATSGSAFAAAIERTRLAGAPTVVELSEPSVADVNPAPTSGSDGGGAGSAQSTAPSPTSPWVLGPVIAEGRVVGHLAIEFSSQDIALELSDHPALGERGEVIAVTRTPDGWRRCAPSPERLDWREGAPPSSSNAPAADADVGRLVIDGEGITHIAAWAPSPSLGWTIVALRPEAEVLAPIDRLTALWWQAMAAGTALAIALALGVARRIAQPIGEAVAAARRMAEGDLTLPPEAVGRGEALDLLRALRGTNDRLTDMLGRVRAASGTIVSSTGDVLGSTRQEEHAVREFAASVQRVAAETSQINASSRQLSTTMVGLARSAEFAATTATAGRTALVDLGKQMGRLNEGGRGVASRLEAIRERAARIDSMVAAITKVANQTNLLAVNAAIEAEKAGVVGHGFQVVAREIDRLATQTAASVLEIEETVIAVQQAVTEGVVEMSHFIDLVDDGCGTANGVASQMGLIIRQAEELRAEFEQVAHSVESQSQGVEQVNAAMAGVVDGAARTAAAVDRSAAVSATLDDAARDLESNIRHFRLPVE